MESSSRQGMCAYGTPTQLILNEDEQNLINRNLEDMNNQLTQLKSELSPRKIAIDISRLQNALVTLHKQVNVIQRTILRASSVAYQNEVGDLYLADPNEVPPFLEDELVELEDDYPDPDEFISPHEAAAILKITLRTIYKRLKDKSLSGTKIQGKWYIKKDVIKNMLNCK